MDEVAPPVFEADDAHALIAYLADRDVACPLCRYNLRGLASTRCPECGNQLRVGVSLAEPYMAGWVATLVALLLPAGPGLIICFGAAYGIYREGLPHAGDFSNIHVTGEFLAGAFIVAHVLLSIPASVSAVVLRRRFLRLRRRTQGVAAAACWLINVASVLCFFSVL